MNAFVTWYTAHMGFLPKQLAVMILSMFPVVELRGGIPLARMLKLPLVQAIAFSVLGNIIPIPFILLFIKQVFKWLKKVPGICKIIEKIENRAMGKSDQITKYEFWGLALFVGIPLPGTGAWTGSLIAALLDIDIKKAVISELIGVAIATIITSILWYGLLGAIIG